MMHKEFIGSDGERWISVTEALSWPPKPWLEAWKAKWGWKALRKTKSATDIGTEFHWAVERLLVSKLPSLFDTRRLQTMYGQFCLWMTAQELNILHTELHVSSERYHYHGTFDAIGYMNDHPKTLTIFDWKTSSGIYPDMALQLAAYAQAYEELTGIKIKRGIIVHVSKDKPHHKLTVKEYKLGKRLFNKFLKRLNGYRENLALAGGV